MSKAKMTLSESDKKMSAEDAELERLEKLFTVLPPTFPLNFLRTGWKVGEASMRSTNDMKINATTSEVLSILRANRDKHAKIVEEAKEGYLKRAREVLEKELKKMQEATSPVPVTVFLNVPQDYTREYDVAIRMLELHTEPSVRLTSEQVQQLVMDDWGWKRHFLLHNSAYSETATRAVAADPGASEAPYQIG